jgi:hypothetical protein
MSLPDLGYSALLLMLGLLNNNKFLMPSSTCEPQVLQDASMKTCELITYLSLSTQLVVLAIVVTLSGVGGTEAP